MSALTIQIPDEFRSRVERLTADEGITAEQFIASAAFEKADAWEQSEYIAQRAALADDKAFLDAVSKIPATPVAESWDRLD